MPLNEDTTEKVCDYCRNDDGREMINLSENNEDEELTNEEF